MTKKMKQVICPACGGENTIPIRYKTTLHNDRNVCLAVVRARVAELEEATRWRPVTEAPDECDWYVTETDEAHARENGKSPYLVQFYDGTWLRPVDRWLPINTDRALPDARQAPTPPQEPPTP